MWRDIRSQKLRTFLTMFGIVWGTVSVSLLLAFGKGLQRQMIVNSSGIGDAICIAWPGLTSVPYEGLGKGRKINLNEEDVEAIRQEARGVNMISSEYSKTLKLNYGAKTIAIDISGVSPEFGPMRNLLPQKGGRFINPSDMSEQRRVLFIGNKMAEDIFGKDVEAVGKTVMLGRLALPPRRSPREQGPELELQRPRQPEGLHPGHDVPRDHGREMGRQPHLPGEGRRRDREGQRRRPARHRPEAALRPRRQGSLLGLGHDRESQVLRDVLPVVPAVSRDHRFLHADRRRHRVSNIMNVVVEERTKEIGIKMALGARDRWLLRQLLLETLLITGLGGAFGFAISFAVCGIFPKFGVGEYVGNPDLSLSVAALTAAILGVTGLIAGYFPARDASRLDPVVAMKL